MGRGRIPMELIQKEKTRKTTFLKRKSGLMKKVYEFSILCGVDVCVIIYGPNFDEQGQVEPETYPKDTNEVHRIIQKYLNTTSDRLPKIYDVQEYYMDRIKKVEGEISKVHKEKIKIMYPTWDESFNDLREDQLLMFVSILDAKIDVCNQRIKLLKPDTKGKKAIVESEKKVDEVVNPYLASSNNPSSSNNVKNFMQGIFQAHIFPPPPPMMMMNPINNDGIQLPFHHFQIGQSSSSQPNSMLHFDDQNCLQLMGQNDGVVNWVGGDDQFASSLNYDDAKFDHMLKENNDGGDEISNQNCSSQSMLQPYNNNFAPQNSPTLHYQAPFQTLLSDLPPGFQHNGIYDANDMLQAQMFNYIHK